MNSKLLCMLYAYMFSNNDYLDILNEDDLKYYDNQKVQKILFNLYIELLRVYQNPTDMEIENFAKLYKSEIQKLNDDEKQYVENDIKKLILSNEKGEDENE